MSKTALYRQTHIELLEIAGKIGNELKPAIISKDASQVRSLLSSLIGKLGIHLIMEDKNLYPSMMSNSDSNISTTAKKFQDEMGGIGASLNDYKQKWANVGEIQKNYEIFINETQSLLKVLGTRIDKENNILYKLYDNS